MPDSSSGKLVRVFIAYPLPLLFAESLRTVQQQNQSLNGFRWTPSENLHVTIFFIGEIQKEKIPAVTEAVSQVAKDCKTFHLEFDAITVEGKRKNGMIWARFKKNPDYADLSVNVYAAVKSLLMREPNIKDPIPHITLARWKPGAEIENLNLSVEGKLSDLDVNVCELWQTVQGKEGVSYDRLARFGIGLA